MNNSHRAFLAICLMIAARIFVAAHRGGAPDDFLMFTGICIGAAMSLLTDILLTPLQTRVRTTDKAKRMSESNAE